MCKWCCGDGSSCAAQIVETLYKKIDVMAQALRAVEYISIYCPDCGCTDPEALADDNKPRHYPHCLIKKALDGLPERQTS
jgi:hypothetical protein